MKTIDDILKQFDETICPCRWIITTPEHTKKDCPHYTFSAEKSFLRSKLLELQAETEKRVSGEIKDILAKHNARILNEFQLQMKPDMPLVWFDERIVLIPAMDIATKETLSLIESPKQ